MPDEPSDHVYEVTDHAEDFRFELRRDGALVGIADYVRHGSTIEIPHTEIEPALRGGGLGVRLVRGSLELIRADGGTVLPSCPFVAAYLDRHPEDQDLLGEQTA